MTDEPIIRWLETFGGSVRVETLGGRKPCYRWRVMAAREVLALLGRVYPYMRVKRQLAENTICELWWKLLVEAGDA